MSTVEEKHIALQNDVDTFNQNDASKVFNLIQSLWSYYKQLLHLDKTKVVDNNVLVDSINVLELCVPKIVSAESVLFPTLPQHLHKSYELIINQELRVDESSANKELTAIFNQLKQCENQADLLNEATNVVKTFLLIVVYNILEFLIGDDLFKQINKCIVLDHLGPRIYGEPEFLKQIAKLNDKIKNSVIDSKQEAEIQKAAGNINYRLNNYSEAISSLCKYLDCVISGKKTGNALNVNQNNEVLTTIICIAYCYEKKNTLEDLSKAIKLLESVKKSESIVLSEIDNQVDRKLSGSVNISIDINDNSELTIEVYHALSHFYNERAVFYKTDTRENDITVSREYISIVKDRDDRGIYHSCDGLVRHENTNYLYALKIYLEALTKCNIDNDEFLKNELLFYLAQSEYAVGEEKAAESNLKLFTEFCDKISNEDALSHARIMRTKSELSRLDLSTIKQSGYFHDKLNFITEKKPSLYVPVSVQFEWNKLIYSIYVFHYIFQILNGSIEFSTGIEEIIYNLNKYSEIGKSDTSSFSNENDSKAITENCVSNDDCFYYLLYKSANLLCYGTVLHDNTNLPKKTESDDDILKLLHTNNRPDVILFTPSKEFDTKTDKMKMLEEILSAKICLVTYNNEDAKIARGCNKLEKSKVYQVDNMDMLLPMGFLFQIYEALRNDLASPTPLLGLAPLGESKSFIYQAGEKTADLITPKTKDLTTLPQKKLLNGMLSFLVETTTETQKSPNTIIDYSCVIELNKNIIIDYKNVSLIAFFPNPRYLNNHVGNFTVPFMIKDIKNDVEDMPNTIKYIPYFKSRTIHSCPPENFSSYCIDYDNCVGFINSGSFCDPCVVEQSVECNEDNNANHILLSKSNIILTNVLLLIRHIIPIYTDDKTNYICLCRKIKGVDNDTIGVLVVFVKIDGDDKEENTLRKICRNIVNNINEKPLNVSYFELLSQYNQIKSGDIVKCPPNNSPEYIDIKYSPDSPIWFFIERLISELKSSADKATQTANTAKTSQQKKLEEQEISESIDKYLKAVETEFAKKNTGLAISADFFRSADSLLNNEGGKPSQGEWKHHLTKDIKDNLTAILEKAISPKENN